MLCLSVRQPWAHAITFGGKRIENRTWTTGHRGPLAIHAARSTSPPGGKIPRAVPGGIPPGEMSFGAVIAVVTLADIIPIHDAVGDPHAFGPWCWVLDDVRPIVPVPFRGWAKLFHVPDTILVPAGQGAISTTTR